VGQQCCVGRRDPAQLEGCYRSARELCEASSYGLFAKTARVTGMKGESVRFGPLEAIQDGGWVGRVAGTCEVKCLDVSAERREAGRVRGEKFGAGDPQELAEM
jgi:hypothetical protein